MSVNDIIKGIQAGAGNQQEYVDRQEFANQWNNFTKNYQTTQQQLQTQDQGRKLKAKLNELALNTGDLDLSNAYDLLGQSVNPLTGDINSDVLSIAGYGSGLAKQRITNDSLINRLFLGQGFRAGLQEDRQANQEARQLDAQVAAIKMDPKKQQAMAAQIAPQLLAELQAASDEYEKTKSPTAKLRKEQIKTHLLRTTADPTLLKEALKGRKSPTVLDQYLFTQQGAPGYRGTGVDSPIDVNLDSILPATGIQRWQN